MAQRSESVVMDIYRLLYLAILLSPQCHRGCDGPTLDAGVPHRCFPNGIDRLPGMSVWLS